MDVFLSDMEVANFQVGNTVTFSVILNKDNKPQARFLEPVDSSSDGRSGPAPAKIPRLSVQPLQVAADMSFMMQSQSMPVMPMPVPPAARPPAVRPPAVRPPAVRPPTAKIAPAKILPQV